MNPELRELFGPTEAGARDRIHELIDYLRVLLYSIADECSSTLASTPHDSDGRKVLNRAGNFVAMAQDFVAEMKELEERPIAGPELSETGSD